MKRLLSLFAVIALFLVSSAQAAQLTPAAVVRRATLAAESYWKVIPCHGFIRVVVGKSTPGAAQTAAIMNSVPFPAGSKILAYTSFDTPDGEDDYEDAPATYNSCEITISPTWDPSDWYQSTGNYEYFCALMVHEIGHLEGHPDLSSDSPTSIEYFKIGPLNDHIKECQKI